MISYVLARFLHLHDAARALFDFLQPHRGVLQQVVQVQLTNFSHALGTASNDINSGIS